jgi:hypothetical protein
MSWPILEHGPWSTMACWQASLMLILGSITIATQQSISLYRYSSYEGGLKMIRRTLRGSQTPAVIAAGAQHFTPTWHYVYVWQLPALMLRAGIICFIIGTMTLLWDAAYGGGHGWNSDSVKVSWYSWILSTKSSLCAGCYRVYGCRSVCACKPLLFAYVYLPSRRLVYGHGLFFTQIWHTLLENIFLMDVLSL